MIKTDQPVGDIFKDEESKQVFSTAASGRMTQNSHRKKSLQAIRRAAKGPTPKQPKTFEEIDFPDWCLKIGETEESFLKYASPPGPEQFYIFATDADIERLIKSPKVYGDGSFMQPNKKLFSQYWVRNLWLLFPLTLIPSLSSHH